MQSLTRITDICSQWTAVGFKRFPAHIWVAVVTMAWSTVSSLQASVQNYAGLIVLRILLGVFEAMFAGVPFYLSFFYPRHKLGLRTGIFLSGSALANAYGGALAYAITGIRGAIEPWRILFLIEGLPTWLVAAAAYFFLPDNLASTKFLNEREKEIAYSFVSRGQDFDPTQDVKITWSEWRMAFLDYKSKSSGNCPVNVCDWRR